MLAKHEASTAGQRSTARNPGSSPDVEEQAVGAYLIRERGRHLAELVEFAAIPSVSALPEHAADVREAAEWLARSLRRAGAPDVALVETGGHPAVIGHWPASIARARTILIYGHFDTQPAEPLDRWTTPPFVPTVRDDRLYGRGTSDDKGNLLIPVRAAEALLRVTGGLPINLVFLFEGEEEIASPNLPRLLAQHRASLQAEAVLSADGVMHDPDRPSLMLGFKGLLSLEIRVQTATEDLHSGIHGGIAPNAALALAHILASLSTPDGQPLVQGLDAGVEPLTDADRARGRAVIFDEEDYRRITGVERPWGDPRYTPLERNWYRPTLDIHGVSGGHQDQGIKTIIPATAHAKLSCRLARGQDPDIVAEALIEHIKSHAPTGAQVTTRVDAAAARAVSISPDNAVMRAVAGALHSFYLIEPLQVLTGGSLPVANMFEVVLGLPTIMCGWSMPDENLHAPDEFFRLENFDRGPRVYADIYRRLGNSETRK